MNENFTIIAKPVPETNEMYFVCYDGEVWTNYRKNGVERFLNPVKTHDGYLSVGLKMNGKMKQFRVHRLVSAAFVENTENKPFVNHKDGDRKNNHFENLEWCTQKENVHHAIHVLKKWSQSEKQSIAASKTGISRRKLDFDTAEKIRNEYSLGNTSSSKLSKKYGLSKPCILKILNNKSYLIRGIV